jgi:repressor LexA
MKEEIKKKGYPPTVREMCAALGIKSTSTTHKDLENLELKGYIKKDPAKPRALMVMDPDSGNRFEVREETPAVYGRTERTDVVDVPVVGRIAAGTPILRSRISRIRYPFPRAFYRKATALCLR